MACDSVITSNIKWSENTDLDLLKKAMEAEGYQASTYGATGQSIVYFHRGRERVTYNAQTHSMIIMNGTELSESRAKQSYLKQIVSTQARRYGFEVTDWTTNAAGNPIATVRRRA